MNKKNIITLGISMLFIIIIFGIIIFKNNKEVIKINDEPIIKTEIKQDDIIEYKSSYQKINELKSFDDKISEVEKLNELDKKE